jgi:hypothetical protein
MSSCATSSRICSPRASYPPLRLPGQPPPLKSDSVFHHPFSLAHARDLLLRFRADSCQLQHLSLAAFNLHKARVRRASGTRTKSPGTHTSTWRPCEVVLNEALALTCPLGSFIPKGDHGIDAHCATGWDVAGGESDSEKHSRDGCKCKRVAGASAIEQAGH